MAQSYDGTFLSRGGLPSRITQPEPGPLTRSAAKQAEAARDIEELSADIISLHRALTRTVAEIEHQRSSPGAQTLAELRGLQGQIGTLQQRLATLAEGLALGQETITALRQERGKLQALCVIAEHLNSTLDRQELLDRMLGDLLQLVQADRGAILLADDAGALRFEAARQNDAAPLARSDFNISRGAVEQVWRSQRPLLTGDAQHDAAVSDFPSVRAQGINSIMCAPLRVQSKAIGVVYVDQRHGGPAFTESHLDLLAAFCNSAAIAIENANLFHQQWLQTQEVAAIKTYTDSMLASISSAVLAVDNLGRVTRANHAAERLLHVSSDTLLGQPYEQALALLDGQGVIELIQQTAGEPDVARSMLVRQPASSKGGARVVNVAWSALCDTERRRLGTVIVLDDLTDLKEAQHAAEIFRKYLDPDVVDLVTQHPTAAELGGRTREISVIFADISGFTALSETLAPNALVALLNDYLALMLDAVAQEGGTITMFQGDAVMAIFNAPDDQPDHALRATRAAHALCLAIERHNQRTGQRQVRCGVGINTGQALVGNIGAQGRLQHYTAIGDAVNIAKRIEENASAGQILLTDATYQLVKGRIKARTLPPVQAKGKSQLLVVWEMQGLA